jgi:peroxiredoxin
MARVIKIVVAMAILAAVLASASCSASAGLEQVPAPGRPAPDFELQSLDGQTISLRDLRGRPVLLNFWATWCGPCRIEMPLLQEVSEDPEWSEEGLVMLAVNLGETPSLVREFVGKNNLTFTILLDTSGKVGTLYNVAAIPMTYFIDEDGIIRETKIGAFVKRADIERGLLNLVNQG